MPYRRINRSTVQRATQILFALQRLPCLQLPVDLERLGVNTVDLAEDKLIMSRA
jgi:hypothetical protein